MKNMKNSVHIIGNVGTNPQLKELQGGKMVTRFAVATHETILKAGEKVRSTSWHTVVAWGKKAEIISKQISKGCLITLEGKLSNRAYDDKSGVKRVVTEILLTDWIANQKKEQKTLVNTLKN